MCFKDVSSSWLPFLVKKKSAVIQQQQFTKKTTTLSFEGAYLMSFKQSAIAIVLNTSNVQEIGSVSE